MSPAKLAPSKPGHSKTGSNTSLAPGFADLIPGVFSELDWLTALEHEDADDFCHELVEEIVNNIDRTIFDAYLEKQLMPYTFDAIKNEIFAVVDFAFVDRDEAPVLNDNVDDGQNGWIEDEEATPGVTECWAQGAVPLVSRKARLSVVGFPGTGKFLEQLFGFHDEYDQHIDDEPSSEPTLASSELAWLPLELVDLDVDEESDDVDEPAAYPEPQAASPELLPPADVPAAASAPVVSSAKPSPHVATVCDQPSSDSDASLVSGQQVTTCVKLSEMLATKLTEALSVAKPPPPQQQQQPASLKVCRTRLPPTAAGASRKLPAGSTAAPVPRTSESKPAPARTSQDQTRPSRTSAGGGHEDVQLDARGNVISMKKINATALPDDRVSTAFRVVKPPDEKRKSAKLPSGVSAIPTMKKTASIQQKSFSMPTRKQNPNSAIAVSFPPLVDSIQLAAGVVFSEGGKVKKGPKPPKTKRIMQELKTLHLPTDERRMLSFSNLIEAPVLRLPEDIAPLPPIQVNR